MSMSTLMPLVIAVLMTNGGFSASESPPRKALPKVCVEAEKAADKCGRHHFGHYELDVPAIRKASKQCFSKRVRVFDFVISCREPMALGKFVTCSVDAIAEVVNPPNKVEFEARVRDYKACVATALEGKIEIPDFRAALERNE